MFFCLVFYFIVITCVCQCVSIKKLDDDDGGGGGDDDDGRFYRLYSNALKPILNSWKIDFLSLSGGSRHWLPYMPQASLMCSAVFSLYGTSARRANGRTDGPASELS